MLECADGTPLGVDTKFAGVNIRAAGADRNELCSEIYGTSADII
jgi:hypothetical protein